MICLFQGFYTTYKSTQSQVTTMDTYCSLCPFFYHHCNLSSTQAFSRWLVLLIGFGLCVVKAICIRQWKQPRTMYLSPNRSTPTS